VQVFGDRLHVVVDAPPPEGELRGMLAAAGVTLHATRRVAPTMEDVFMHLARGAA
jgi:hypothetical protein